MRCGQHACITLHQILCDAGMLPVGLVLLILLLTVLRLPVAELSMAQAASCTSQAARSCWRWWWASSGRTTCTTSSSPWWAPSSSAPTCSTTSRRAQAAPHLVPSEGRATVCRESSCCVAAKAACMHACRSGLCVGWRLAVTISPRSVTACVMILLADARVTLLWAQMNRQSHHRTLAAAHHLHSVPCMC